MKVGYVLATTTAEVARYLDGLHFRTVIFDVEPYVAFWDTSRTELDDGMAKVVDSMQESDVIVFSTNSTRRPSAVPQTGSPEVRYLAAAAKPLRTAAYRNLPGPGVVVGDQIATDGVLAWRLGYAFVHFQPDLPVTPLGPRAMGLIGRALRPLFFDRT
jgi:predicted HAD superfamily phosphohydrolase YqeG